MSECDSSIPALLGSLFSVYALPRVFPTMVAPKGGVYVENGNRNPTQHQKDRKIQGGQPAGFDAAVYRFSTCIRHPRRRNLNTRVLLWC